jgi:hypothetical protein
MNKLEEEEITSFDRTVTGTTCTAVDLERLRGTASLKAQESRAQKHLSKEGKECKMALHEQQRD